MVTDCRHCPLRKLDLFDGMSSAEVDFMQRFKSGELKIDAGTPVLMEGSNSPQLFTALKGMGLRYKLLPNGDRQVVNFVLPGDFIGLQAGVMGEMQHSVEATTPMVLCVFDRSSFWNLYKNQPERAFDLTWAAAVEEHLLGEALAVVGQMDGLERISWGLLRFFDRCDALGLARDGQCPFPFRQQDLADATGLSLVHTNKTLRKLRDRQILAIDNGFLKVFDRDDASEIAGMTDEKPRRRPLI